MNNKGFSLVELLAVIVIIALVSTIAVVSMGGIRNNIDEKIIESNLDLIDSAAKSYGEDHMSEIMTGVSHKTVAELKGLTELDTDNAYNSIQLYIYLKNRRASVCIANKEALSELTSNIDHFSKYFCNFGDVNDDGELTCEDLQLLFDAVSSLHPENININRGNAELNVDGVVNNNDVVALNRKLQEDGKNCSYLSN